MGAFTWRALVILFAFIVVQVEGGCEPGKIKCPLSNDCIPPSYVCDGGADCNGGSDETYCNQREPIKCPADQFQCHSGRCFPKSFFCDLKNHCGDASDEFFCNLEQPVRCPFNWMRCADGRRCVQKNWKCDGIKDCFDGSDENDCGNIPASIRTKIPKMISAMNRNIRWLLSRKKSGSSTNRWGHDLHRIATALYLADEGYFTPGNRTGDEMSYELSIQLLYKLSGNNTMRSQELALYIHALIVTCADPRDFFGHNLVSELRNRVESSNYTNPFEILALCNAGDAMSNSDIERVTTAFDSQHRPFWTDTQAIATMAMQCLSSSPNVRVDERLVKDMEGELKKHQFRNGTVDNPVTTALVLQALMGNASYAKYFDAGAAISVLLENQKSDGSWGSIQNSYYALPVLKFRSLLNISRKHCVKQQESEEEALQKLQNGRGDKFVVQYSIWIGNEVDLGKTWRIRMETTANNSFYDVIETVRKLDSKHNVTYNVIDNKPYVSGLYGKEDDPELGVYWFTYVRSLALPEAPKLIEASPVDVKVVPKQELILWYTPGGWSGSQQDA